MIPSLNTTTLVRPHFGQVVTLVLIYLALTGAPFAVAIPDGERLGPVSVLGILPEPLRRDPAVFAVLRRTLQIAGVLWAFQLAVPWTGWLTALAFTGAIAFHHENSDRIAHVHHLTALLLFVQALWYHVYRKEIRAGLRNGTFWSSPLYPGWAAGLSILVIGLYHSFAGLSKLWASGPAWANGLSLQLWVHLWGRADSPFTSLVASDRRIAAGFQAAVLLLETASLLALFSARLRLAIGLGLCGFYAAVLSTFGWQFERNLVLVALFFLPFDRLCAWACDLGHQIGIRGRWQPLSPAIDAVCRPLLARVDVLQIISRDVVAPLETVRQTGGAGLAPHLRLADRSAGDEDEETGRPCAGRIGNPSGGEGARRVA